MKKVLKFLCSRLVIVTLAILVQFCFLLFIVLKLSTYGLYAYVSLQLISLVVVLWIVTKRDNPSYKIAWIIAILIFPIFGGIFYLVFGNKTMDKKQAQRIRELTAAGVGEDTRGRIRIRRLEEMAKENRDLAALLEHYYERGYLKNERYTL